MAIPPPPKDPKDLGSGTVPPPPADPSQLVVERPSLGRRFAAYVEDKGPAIAGSVMGAIVGAPLGPAGAVAGAALGGAGGEAVKKDVEYLMGTKDPANDSSLKNAADISGAGVAQAAAEGAGQLATGALKFAIQRYGDTLARIGGQLSKITASVPEKYATAVLKDPHILERAPSAAELGKMYTKFEAEAGLKGLEPHVIETYNRFSLPASQYEEMVLNTAKRVFASKAAGELTQQAAAAAGTPAEKALVAEAARVAAEAGGPVTSQELYLASQAASKLRQMAKFGEPQAQMAAASAALDQSKALIDDALEAAHPGYQALRQAAFESHAREAFESVLPLNKGGTPNVLKSLAGASQGPLGLLTVSPAAQGAALRTVTATAGNEAVQATARAVGGMAASGLSDRARKILGY